MKNVTLVKVVGWRLMVLNKKEKTKNDKFHLKEF